MKVTVVGAGGVGGYFGGRLALAGVDVSFLARGEHLDALRADGLRVRSVRGDFEVPVTATDDPASIGEADYVLVTVKSFDTDRVASLLPSLVGEGTAVVSLQNGVDNEERLARVVGEDRVLGGAAYIFATITAPGEVTHTGGPASVVVGAWGERREPTRGVLGQDVPRRRGHRRSLRGHPRRAVVEVRLHLRPGRGHGGRAAADR